MLWTWCNLPHTSILSGRTACRDNLSCQGCATPHWCHPRLMCQTAWELSYPEITARNWSLLAGFFCSNKNEPLYCELLGRAPRSRDGLTESCTCRRGGPPPYHIPTSPQGWPPHPPGWPYLNMWRHHVTWQLGGARSAFMLTKRTCWRWCFWRFWARPLSDWMTLATKQREFHTLYYCFQCLIFESSKVAIGIQWLLEVDLFRQIHAREKRKRNINLWQDSCLHWPDVSPGLFELRFRVPSSNTFNSCPEVPGKQKASFQWLCILYISEPSVKRNVPTSQRYLQVIIDSLVFRLRFPFALK